MTDNEIITALECCRGFNGECDGCPMIDENSCNDKLKQIAADRIKELNIELESMRTAANSYKLHYEKLLPCKVGDEVWAIRTYGNGTKVPQKGKVSEMYYIDESMKLCIVVKGITRGAWGEKVFPSFEEAESYLGGAKC